MDRDPGAGLEEFVAREVREAAEPSPGAGAGGRRTLRAAAAFLAFFLGVSLTVGSLGGLAGRWAWERDTDQWWRGDWQETSSFRWAVSNYLEEFLTLGAGGTLDWYDEAVTEVYDSVIARQYEYSLSPGWSWSEMPAEYRAYAYADPESSSLDAILKAEPDYFYKSNKNVLYHVLRQGRSKYDSAGSYSNTGEGQSLSSYDALPEGYNFLLTFADGKVRIWKDGTELDVYGGGVYTDESLWFVPGYENFQAGEGVEDVTVSFAIRQTPMQYLRGNYSGGGVYQNNRLYNLYQGMEHSRTFYRTMAVTLALGLLFLAAWVPLRRDRAAVDAKLASWTVHVWTEFRFLAVAVGLVGLGLSGINGFWNIEELWYGFYFGDFPSFHLSSFARSLAACLDNVPALLGLTWLFWLLHNDHRHHPKAERRSLWRLLRAKELKRPVEKRLSRGAVAGLAAPAILALCALPAGLVVLNHRFNGYYRDGWLLLAAVFLLVFCALSVWLVLSSRNLLRTARDIGLLADQVEAIREGDLSTPLTLPDDADLRKTAESLNDIQSGMHKALAEQTRSERMKVELISNVSHDLKTPLTSILSYAELLRQEELPPAAADYARIIDEKAQRLKTMVQDVFDVSKASASQLPVHLERLDLGKLLRQTLADMADPIAASRLTFKTDLPEEPVMITADGKRLYRVFQNLIQNALQYALEGSRVHLTLKAGNGQAEAAVRNTSRGELSGGVDFTARFVRGDESRTDGGSGLGLSIASSFTEACGGSFRVETVADLFTAVVTFPLAEEAD